MSQTIQNSGLKHYQYLPILFLGGVPCYIVIITSYNIPRDPLIVVLRDASLEFGIFILGTAPLCNSYMKLIIWLYIALNMTPNTDCYRVGGGQATHVIRQSSVEWLPVRAQAQITYLCQRTYRKKTY